MRYIEIKPGLSVLRKEIVAIEEDDQLNARVYTKAGIFDSQIPRLALVGLLEQSEHEESIDPVQERIADSLRNLEKDRQMFAG